MKSLQKLAFVPIILAAPLIACAQSSPRLKPNFSNVVNFAQAKKVLKLDSQHLAMLRKNMFVVTPGDDIQLYNVLATNDYANLSSIVTSDNVLQLYHVFYDTTLRHVEEHHLYFDMQRLTSSMLRQATRHYQNVKGTKLASAALKNVAFFGVADRLAGLKDDVPAEADALIRAELAMVDGHQGSSRSAIFPYDVDYSQFIVRGHYTRSQKLTQYFRTLMWFGLMPFSIEARTGTTSVAVPEQVRQAIMVVEDLENSGSKPFWNRIYRTTDLYVGESNDLAPSQLVEAVRPVAGWPLKPADLANEKVIARIAMAIRKAAHPKIVLKSKKGTLAGDVQFRFMGQRATPDSVVFNRVNHYKMRPWPIPLDVAAALGSERASAILDASPKLYNPKGWSEYRSERSAVTRDFETWTAADWKRNLYNSSLDLLRLNLSRPQRNQPRFVKSDAWADKSLNSSLAFWAELKHDTLLYGLQTGAEMGDGEEQPFVKGYVEPNQKVYRKVANCLTRMEKALKGFGYLNNKETEQFDNFQDLLQFVMSVSEIELTGGKLSKDDHWRLRRIEGQMAYVNTNIQLVGENYQSLSEDDEDMALVADVHTSDGKALTVATGHADDLIAVVPIEGQLYLARGSAYTFYEFKVPVSGRLTDHAWKNMLRAHEAPARQPWIKSYFVNRSSRQPEK